MIDLYFKTETEEEFDQLMIDNNLAQYYEDQLVPILGVSIDKIGTIYLYDGTEEPIALVGYHANVRSYGLQQELLDIFSPYLVTPKVPYRVWL